MIEVETATMNAPEVKELSDLLFDPTPTLEEKSTVPRHSEEFMKGYHRVLVDVTNYMDTIRNEFGNEGYKLVAQELEQAYSHNDDAKNRPALLSGSFIHVDGQDLVSFYIREEGLGGSQMKRLNGDPMDVRDVLVDHYDSIGRMQVNHALRRSSERLGEDSVESFQNYARIFAPKGLTRKSPRADIAQGIIQARRQYEAFRDQHRYTLQTYKVESKRAA